MSSDYDGAVWVLETSVVKGLLAPFDVSSWVRFCFEEGGRGIEELDRFDGFVLEGLRESLGCCFNWDFGL